MTSNKVSWLKRDVLLFANSIGCKADELHFLYELHPEFQVFPTYPVILSFKDDTQEVIDFYAAEKAYNYAGIPKFDSSRVVDGQRSLRIFKRLPVTSKGMNFEIRRRVIGVYDKGNAGSVLHTRHDIVDASKEEIYASIEVWSFYVGQGNWGGPRGPAMDDISPTRDRKPDLIVSCQTTPETPLLYRLNGDYNPLHATPAPGMAMGFGGVILHGLIAWNMTCHAILRSLCLTTKDNLKEFQARFAAPVKGNDKLIIEIWRMGEIEEGWEEVRFITRIEGGKVCLRNGRAVVRSVAGGLDESPPASTDMITAHKSSL